MRYDTRVTDDHRKLKMDEMFDCGLVVGKFSPLHRGHEYLIGRAMERCARVVIISYASPEHPGCGAEQRERWLAGRFPEAEALVIDQKRLSGCTAMPSGMRTLPQDNAPDDVHRRFVGALCTHVLGLTVDAVFTSEDYGDGLAKVLTHWFNRPVTHILVDKDRLTVPISGSAIRADIHAHQQWMAPSVYADHVRRVCILGGESSGKSTLARQMGHRFHTRHVAEYGRELWEARAGRLSYPDMIHIAVEQIAREEEAVQRADRCIFCDTSPLTTLFYSRHLFGKADPRLEQMAARPYDLVVLCMPDFPFVQDGTRQPSAFRDRQHGWYLKELACRGIEFMSAGGATRKRVDALSEAVCRRFNDGRW